jgi:hypothetical protein
VSGIRPCESLQHSLELCKEWSISRTIWLPRNRFCARKVLRPSSWVRLCRFYGGCLCLELIDEFVWALRASAPACCQDALHADSSFEIGGPPYHFASASTSQPCLVGWCRVGRLLRSVFKQRITGTPKPSALSPSNFHPSLRVNVYLRIFLLSPPCEHRTLASSPPEMIWPPVSDHYISQFLVISSQPRVALIVRLYEEGNFVPLPLDSLHHGLRVGYKHSRTSVIPVWNPIQLEVL